MEELTLPEGTRAFRPASSEAIDHARGLLADAGFKLPETFTPGDFLYIAPDEDGFFFRPDGDDNTILTGRIVGVFHLL